ncbi:MAG: FtsX-like permease family protein [Eubacterium sp.]|nr:FtsX-like permease family protein [Eubacterium sp.]
MDLLEKIRSKQELAAGTNNMLIWIASIALLVGGIGVMNIMLVSVTERTPEIGLRKALGARKRRILTQFLTESVLLTSFGGVIGVVVGIILAKVISGVSNTPMAISVPSIILGVVFSMCIGIIFGLVPSIKAANLNPIDALRRE